MISLNHTFRMNMITLTHTFNDIYLRPDTGYFNYTNKSLMLHIVQRIGHLVLLKYHVNRLVLNH